MAIAIDDLTGGNVAGAGIYDELMRTTLAHVEKEHAAGRITDANYATVYLGALQSNLATASQFLLQYELTNQNIIIAEEQVKDIKAGILLKEEQLLGVTKQNLLLDAQLVQAVSANKQTIQQTHLVDAQTATQGKQLDVMSSQIAVQNAQALVSGAQVAVVNAQAATELANTTEPTAGISKAQYDKLLADESLATAKAATEAAQTVGDSGTIAGLVGAEIVLKDLQGASFSRDAEQKAAKFYADVLAIGYSVDTAGNDPANWGLGPVDSELVMKKLRDGIGI